MMLLQCNLNFRQGTHIKSKARAFEVKKAAYDASGAGEKQRGKFPGEVPFCKACAELQFILGRVSWFLFYV